MYMIHQIALRIDQMSENTLKIIFQFMVDEKFQQYIISQEVSKISKKVHYHMYMCTETNLTYKSYTNRLRQSIKDKFECKPFQYCLQKCKDVQKYLLYMCKDLAIEKTYGFEDAEIQQILKDTKRINREKTQQMKHQLVEHIFNTDDVHDDYRMIMKSIVTYHVDRDYLPPSPTLLLQYTLYVMVKLKLDTTELYMAKLNI